MGLYWNSSPQAPIASLLLLENVVKSWYKALQIKQGFICFICQCQIKEKLC